MPNSYPFVDIHCHLVPGIDDGADSWDAALAMAKIAVGDGIETVVVTPHQLGTFVHNDGETIRRKTESLQAFLQEHDLPLRVLPGADVRIEEGIAFKVRAGEVLTLADRKKHLLLELPHELYFPLNGVLDQLRAIGVDGILSHPERNQGILQDPDIIDDLIAMGCLMQVTAGSLMGTFGRRSQQLAEEMLVREQVHFLATDAHGPRSRRPLMRRAFERVIELTSEQTALEVCCRNPASVANGQPVLAREPIRKKSSVASWFGWRKAG